MKDIKGYEGLYAVTEDGRVWSHRRQIFLKEGKTKAGYLNVVLCKNGKAKTFLVHRLVAQTYITNPLELPEINHKDENKENNSINNLEWCDRKYNINYGSRNDKVRKAIYCVELNRVFESQMAAAKELGLIRQHINACCNGRQKTHGGYHWEFVEKQ